MIVERNNKERIYFGANITGGEGGTANLELLRSSNLLYVLRDNGQEGSPYLTIRDLQGSGARIEESNAAIFPSDTKLVSLGSKSYKIRANSYRGITLDGKPPTA